MAQTPTGASLLTLDQTTTDALRRQAGPEEGATSLAILKGPDGQPALGVKVGDLQSWETLEYRLQSPGFPEGHELTCFWAKGSRKTTHLTVEWREDDKSRWMATVGLTPSWERYVLAPRDFKYWPDNVAQGRGDGGDHLRPAHAAAFMFGLAKSHAALPEGPHSYAIAEIGTAASPYPSLLAQAPIIEAVSPPYKTFAPTSARKITGPDVDLPATSNISCAIPRARGLGIRKARIGRWIPLLEARDAKGDLRGIAGSVYISLAEPYPGAAWGTIGIEGPEYIERHMDPIGPVVAGMARRLLGRVHISKAGADQFSYLPGEAPIIGGQIANDSDRGQELHLDMTVTQVGHAAPAFTKTWAISALPGVLTGESARWDRPTEHGTYVARAVLRQGDEVLDELSHSFVRLATPEAASSAYVSVRDGEFWLAGKRWHPHGINYWPSSSTALEWFSYWLHWLHPTNYDPSVIERDLAALADLKMNSVSIALRNRDELPAFNHFASRCAEHGVRINLFVGGGDPVGFNVESTLDLIEAGHLASNPTIYAWDISWEPHFGPFENRLRLDAWWDEWIAERYGSVENAEADWGVDAPRAAGGQITGPSQEQILNDGDHRVMVAAYRRFLDDLVSRSYGEWARKVRAVDPHHLIGVRSGYGGTGQAGIDHAMPFDLMAGAKHLDFISPEGYGIGGDWENYERGGFTTAYARFAGNGRPVFWSEFGRSIHPEYSSERIEEQRLLYERTYRMVAWSGANGSAGWWFPGGFRVGENSDYGIMNPDGTPRPSALDARKWAARIDDLKHVPEVTHWITIDGDLHPRGYSQVIARHADEYVSARRRGEIVGLRAEGTGTDSTATSMTAVGNTRADGANPHKYLNAEFNTVRVRVGGGAWIDATPGATVEVEANRAIECVATIGNSGEALWVSPAIAGDRPGGVYLVDAPGSDLVVDQPITIDVPRYGDTLVGPFELSAGIDAKANVALRVEARGRTPFGGHFRFALAPR